MSKVDLGRVISGVTAGDSLQSETLIAVAYTTGNNKTLDILIPMALQGVSSFTCTGLVLSIRSPTGGYVPSNDFNVISASETSIGTKTVRKNGIYIRVTNTGTWANISNNMPCVGTVTFTGTFS